jgi:L,D-transpeptidase YcbB
MGLFVSRTLPFLLLAMMPLWTHASPLLNNTLEALRDTKMVALEGVPLLSGRLLAEFYARRGNALVWTQPAQIAALQQLVHDSRAEGFDPQDFHAAALRSVAAADAFTTLTEAARIAADITLSDALLRYVHHTRFGKLEPTEVDPKYNDRDPVPASQLLDDMTGALDAPDVQGFLAARFPQPFWYTNLKKTLAQFISPAELADVPPLPAGGKLVKGTRDPRIPLLRERLQVLNGQRVTPTAAPLPDADVYDAALHAEVVAFQQRLGLFPDGIVGASTLAALNQPGDTEKAEKVRINLERMRWLFNNLGADYVFVDVTNYQAHVVRAGAIAWSTRVIVGETESQTPMFRDTMNHVVLNPTWTVPISIQKTMGRVSEHYTVVDRQTGRKFSGGDVSNYKRYRVVQQPGPKNALGRVKFMFPNRHSVYLHDTPNKNLFGRSSRALSHGCVRVQNPVKLAEILLAESGWDRGRIDQVLTSTKTRYVNLQEGLPVLLYYLTAFANEEGKVLFRPDIYGRDQRVTELLAQPVLSARIAFPETTPLLPAPVAPPVNEEVEEEQMPDEAPSVVPTASDAVRLTQVEN